MKSIALIASNVLIPISVITPVVSTLNSYKNNLSANDISSKSTYLSDKGTNVCNELRTIYPSWHSWCMQKQQEGSGS